MLKLFAADDGYEPSRTAEAMKQLYEKDQVFGVIGNVGTPTAAVAIPYALERRMLFFGPSPGPTSCATIRRIATSSTIAPAMFRKPTRSFVTSSRFADCSRARSRSLRSRIRTAIPDLRAWRKAFRSMGVNDGTILGSTMRETPSTWTTRSIS
jgi:ABC-type branched-subunit amino acid transport system substrate-binding protein